MQPNGDTAISGPGELRPRGANKAHRPLLGRRPSGVCGSPLTRGHHSPGITTHRGHHSPGVTTHRGGHHCDGVGAIGGKGADGTYFGCAEARRKWVLEFVEAVNGCWKLVLDIVGVEWE